MFEYKKAKSAAKTIIPRGDILENKILNTLKSISTIVGGTLGPGGHPVLIERQEHRLGCTVTKDGVTVFRSLGFNDASAHCILETARDAATRTASEAGDGTTTATILAEAINRYTKEFCNKYPNISPHRIVRIIHSILKDTIEPELEDLALDIGLVPNTPERKLALAVATISGNGDEPLANAVMNCFDITGDEGNVTILEGTGPLSKYEVQPVSGYPINMGYETSTPKWYSTFINDQATQKVVIDNPIFLLFFGRLNDLNPFVEILSHLQDLFDNKFTKQHNVIIVANGFSEAVIQKLAYNWADPSSINIYPLQVPWDSPIHNHQKHFLDDLSAVVSGVVYDPDINTLNPLVDNTGSPIVENLVELGNVQLDPEDSERFSPEGIHRVEISRFKTMVLGDSDPDFILERIEELKQMASDPESELDATLLNERMAKLTQGIAQLKVIGSSSGDLRERRDRAEDAVCAVRGALLHGATPGGGWTLARLINVLGAKYVDDLERDVVEHILVPSFREPINRLYENSGFISERKEMVDRLCLNASDPDNLETFDCLNLRWVDAYESGIIDSLPAVREAIRNSISVAALMGTCGGLVVFPRDHSFDEEEGHSTAEFVRTATQNPVNDKF